MSIKKTLLAAVLVLAATSAVSAQSQTGNNFGVPPSGTAASRGGGGGRVYVHVHARNTGERSAPSHGSEHGGEIDARDASGPSPVARQASTPNK